jgi:hypothetical protein
MRAWERNNIHQKEGEGMKISGTFEVNLNPVPSYAEVKNSATVAELEAVLTWMKLNGAK